MTFELLRPVNGTRSNNGWGHGGFVFGRDFLDVCETIFVWFTFKCLGFSQRNRDVVVFDFTGLGQMNLFFHANFGNFLALACTAVVPGAEVKHVTFGAVGQTGATSTGGKFRVETFGFKFGDEFFDFTTARRLVLVFSNGPSSVSVTMIVGTTSTLSELSTTHATRTQSREV